MHLDDSKPLVARGLQVQAPARQGGQRRSLGVMESLSLILSALGTAQEWTGVRWKNVRDEQGVPVAIAMIRDAEFSMTQNGETILSHDPKMISRGETK